MGQNDSAPIYEYRAYEIAPGKSAALNRRFEQVTLRLFQRHGFRLVGMWQPVVSSSNQLFYLLEWDDMNARERGFAALRADQEWQTAFEESERDGPLVVNVRNEFWRNAPYAPRPRTA